MINNKSFFFLIIIFSSLSIFSQSDKNDYPDDVNRFRQKYKRDLIRDLHSPITKYDLRFIHFFNPDSDYKVKCKATPLKNQDFFDFLTSSGAKRKYRKFAKLTCELKDTTIELYTYESERLLKSKKYKDYIFLPFTDNTNGETTYGGGRYLDLNRDDFKDNTVLIDFNLCYNPYCAYSSGYSCAIPPKENSLPVFIFAGEKTYTGEKKHRKKSKVYKKRQMDKLDKTGKKLRKQAKKSILKAKKINHNNQKTDAGTTPKKRYFEPGQEKMKIEKK